MSAFNCTSCNKTFGSLHGFKTHYGMKHRKKKTKKKQRKKQLLKALKKYNLSVKGKERTQKYEKTAKAKKRRQKYEKSSKGRNRRQKYQNSNKGRRTLKKNSDARKERNRQLRDAKKEQKRKEAKIWHAQMLKREEMKEKEFWRQMDVVMVETGFRGKFIRESRLRYMETFGTDDYYDDTNAGLMEVERDYKEVGQN